MFLSAVPVLAQDPSNAYYQAGNTLYTQKNYDLAIRYYQAALQMNPNKWEADQGMGNCYYAKGDKAGALASYQRALAINPNNPQLSAFVQALQAQLPPQPAGMGNDLAASPAGNRAGQPGAVGRNPNLPKEGGLVIEGNLGVWMDSWQDIQDLYGSGSGGTPTGLKVDLGASLAVMPNFQVGVRLHGLMKQPEEIDDLGTTITFNETALGLAAVGEADIPIDNGINFLGSLELGFYTLIGSSVTSTATSNSDSLSGSGLGGSLSAGVELLMDPGKSWAVDLSLGYQMLSISPVTATPAQGNAYTIPKAAGGDWALDLSGPELTVGVRFF